MLCLDLRHKATKADDFFLMPRVHAKNLQSLRKRINFLSRKGSSGKIQGQAQSLDADNGDHHEQVARESYHLLIQKEHEDYFLHCGILCETS